jgi:histidinol-phosphate aminotransferase
MITSRRGFLRSLGAGTAAVVAVHWPLTGASRATRFEPPSPLQNDGFIRLNSNENAYGPSPKVVAVMKSSIGSANRYPRMEYKSLEERIAAANRVKPEQVLIGCGSTEILRMAAFAFLANG